jgi:hypothetical protein
MMTARILVIILKRASNDMDGSCGRTPNCVLDRSSLPLGGFVAVNDEFGRTTVNP